MQIAPFGIRRCTVPYSYIHRPAMLSLSRWSQVDRERPTMELFQCGRGWKWTSNFENRKFWFTAWSTTRWIIFP
jgi:hypothetical protein